MNKPIFVFDCNAVISAHLLPQSVSRIAYEKALEKGILIRSPDTYAEFSSRFLRPKFDKYLPVAERILLISEYKQKSIEVLPLQTIRACRDPKDDMYLELAVVSHAFAIISGDKHLLEMHPFRGISILNAADFLSLY